MEDPIKPGDAGGQSGEGAGAESEEKKEVAGGSAGDGGDNGAGKKEPELQKKEEDGEPPQRKSKFEYILARKEKQLEKVKSDKEVKKSEEEDDDAPDDEKLVTKAVDRKYGKRFARMDALEAEAQERANEADIKEFIAEDPLGKYCKDIAGKIRTWSKHPSRANVPIKTIAMEILGEKGLLEIGAKMEKEAAKKAAESKSGGGSARGNEGGAKDYSNMSTEEFEKEIAKVKGRQ
jgi:hypothetical protein